MADDRSQAGRRSWRGKPEPDRRERPRTTEKSSYKWANRGKRPAAGDGAGGSRSVRLLAGLVAFAGCLGVVVWLIWMINPPEPAAVVLLGADYATNLAVPHNVPGYRGLKDIGELSRAAQPYRLFNPAQLQLLSNPANRTVLETPDDWKATIAALKKGFREKTLILVMALHGGSDADGAYLMPNRMKRPEDGLRMKDVIAEMDKLPHEKTKILVVEGAQVESDWRLGMIHNDFARRLKELEPEILAVPNLWVLSGGDADQRCWASEGLGRTVFLHYFTEALRGGGGAAGPDGRLSLDELYRHVRDNVRRWAWSAREAVQVPVLIPSLAGGGGKSAGAPAAAPGRARLDPASIHLATVETLKPVEAPPPPDRDALSRAWLRFRQLDRMVPHPSVYSPIRWRAYGAALIRYEQLQLAGAVEPAALISKELSDLETAIGKDRVLSDMGTSAGVNLVMDALNGGGVGAAADPPEFNKIAQASNDPDARKIWETLRAGETAGGDGRAPARPLRSRLAEFLLMRQAQGDGVEDLKRAADRIGLTGLPGQPLAAESHFLRMLSAKLSPSLEDRRPAFFARATQSLRVRVLAERAAMGAALRSAAYPYSEQVLAWTQSLVERADARRRDGEDRLFANEDTAWVQAGKDLTTADAGYNDALHQAGTIQAALAVRDRAFAALPDYARWLVHRRPDQPGDDLAGKVETLWSRAHELSGLLERPGETAKIPGVVKELDAGLVDLVRRFEAETDALARDRQRQDWEAESAAAAVPFPDDEKLARRAAIWDRLERIRLHDIEVARSSTPAPKAAESSDARREAEPARRAALQGALAMAALGATWFGDPGFKDADQGDYRKTLDRLRGLPAATAWQDEAAPQGDRIGLRFRALRERIDALIGEGRGLTDLASRLAEADRLARSVDRGGDPPAESFVEPSSRYRRLRAHNLLVWMAERAWLDHWYDKDPDAPPYYAAVVGQLFKDAQGLFPDFRDDDQKRRAVLDAPNRLEIENTPERLVVTSELGAAAGYRVVDATGPRMAKVPPGIPVVRPMVSEPLSLADPSAGYRAAARGAPAPAEFRLISPIFELAESRADGFEALLANQGGRPAALKIDGFFRGQVFSRPTEVDLQVIPDAVAIGPAPPDPARASIAVRTSDEIFRQFGEGTGSVAIVLDCSGSMITDGDGSKWPKAKAALKQVLKESVPKGTNLSLWTFSQLPDGIQVNANGGIVPGQAPNLMAIANANFAAPEQTILCQLPMAPWDPAKADGVGALLDRLNPFFQTPLVEAMWKAASTDLANARGLKNLLVLTDGDDNRFEKSQELNPGGRLTIPDFLAQRFRTLGIRITVVYFRSFGQGAEAKQKEQAEAQTARGNFEKPLQGLEPRGQFIEAKDINELIESLRSGLQQKLVCQVLKDGRPAGEETLEVTRPGDVPRWWASGLVPGFYTLRIVADRPYEKMVNLMWGDRLVVELIEDGSGGIAFRRAIYGDEEEFRAYRIDPRPRGGDWQVSILGDQKTGDKVAGLNLMAAIESTATAAAALEQARPAWVGFRLTGEGLREPPSGLALRWRERLTYPAPVWQLDVPRWPRDPANPGIAAEPILTAWWLGPGALPHDAEFSPDPAGLASEVPLRDGRSVRVEGFRQEDHFVEIKPGEPPQSRPCLVIRLEYPKDSPYFVDPGSLGGVETTGYEHRDYTRARKYAGLFWPVNADQYNILRKGKFGLVSLKGLRDRAEKLKQKVEIKPGRPRDNAKLPEPPEAIRR